MSDSHKLEVIDVDDLFGLRIPTPPPYPASLKWRLPHGAPATISLIDSDSEDEHPVASSSRSAKPPDEPPHPHSTSGLTQLQLTTRWEVARRVHDGRPVKRRATDIKLETPPNERKRKEPSPEIIEISSDSEPETVPLKRQKLDKYAASPHHTVNKLVDVADIPKLGAELSRTGLRSSTPSDPGHDNDDDDDDDDGCIDFLAALDISNETNWAPLPERNKAEDLTPIHEPDCKFTKLQPVSPHLHRKKPPVDLSLVPRGWDSMGPWGILRHGLVKFPKPFHYARRQDRLFPRRSPNLYYENGYTNLQLTAKYPHLASGSVNKIVQAQGTVVLCASVVKGMDESDDEDEDDRPPPPPENKLGSLVVHHRGRVHMAPTAHCRQWKISRDLVTKYYCVTDIAFNPSNPRQFLSSGCDGFVQVWEIHDDDDRRGLRKIRLIEFESRPLDLHYAPHGSAVAITCYDGAVYIYPQDLFDEEMIDEASFPYKRLRAAPNGAGHATGATLWGRGRSTDLIFTSSESTEKADFSGFHHAFDAVRGGQVWQFDATESGDAAAITPDGTTLALFTWARDRTHPVRLYDVGRRQKMAYETEKLEKFQARPRTSSTAEPASDVEEVNQASFSPDGRLLAVARNDNELHIYDMRALSRGPLCQFAHHESDTLSGAHFGVVGVKWISSSERIGIVSGGNDGCVRLWEPALGCTNDVQGAVIGRTDFDVSHFSVGDRRNGELPLVIGDSGGGIHTYDFTNEDGVPI